MKLSCFEMMVGDRPLLDKFEIVAAAGFDGIDLRGDLLHDHVQDAVSCAARTGLAIPTVYGRMSGPLLARTLHERVDAMQVLRTRLADAAAVGAQQLVLVPITGAPRIDVDLGAGVEQIEWSVLAVLLRELLADGLASDVTIALEPLNKAETHLVTSPTEAATFTRRLDHARIGMMIDTYHVDREGQDLVAEVAGTADQLRLVHLSDRDRRLPGLGGIDFEPFIAELNRSGYSGYGGFECVGPFSVSELEASVRWVRDGARGRLEPEGAAHT